MNRYKRPAPRAQTSKNHKQNEVAQHANETQQAERHPPKVKVAGSNPVNPLHPQRNQNNRTRANNAQETNTSERPGSALRMKLNKLSVTLPK